MYNMSIVTHNYGVIGILGTIFINILMLVRATDIDKYTRVLSIFMPIGMTAIGAVVFTGIVMMAAKHLDFTFENIVMIIFAITLIVLENMRSKKLNAMDKKQEDAMKLHKVDAYKIFKNRDFNGSCNLNLDVGLIYVLHDEASKTSLSIKGELYKYLVKVRRHSLGDELFFRNKEHINMLYKYRVQSVESRVLELELMSSKEEITLSKKSLHIAWCVIDIKSIEKVLPSLNEIGVEKISFIYCDRSQKNIKLDFKRFERILEASMQQCGRSSYMELDTYKSIKEFLKEFEDVKVFDFCENILDSDADFSRVLIGCEGGFSQEERELLIEKESFRLNTPMVLRSESAAIAVASKILL